jgi:hypothetical protein
MGVYELAFGEDIKMRLLCFHYPACRVSEQKELYDDIMSVVKESFGSFIMAREHGALIGRGVAAEDKKGAGVE